MSDERKVQAKITAKDETAAALGSFVKGLVGVLAIVKGVQGALGALKSAVIEVTKAAAAQEQADVRLAIALRSLGQNTEANRKKFGDFASEIQDTTGIADDAVLEMMATIVQLGKVGPENLERVSRAAIQLAQVSGKDLSGVGMAMGKAAGGMSAALSRYVGKLDESLTEAEKFEQALQRIEGQMGGTAEALGKTLTGQIEIAKGAWGDLLEILGAPTREAAKILLEELITPGIKGLQNVAGETDVWRVAVAEAAITLVEATRSVATLVATAGGFDAVLGRIKGNLLAIRAGAQPTAENWAALFEHLYEKTDSADTKTRAFWLTLESLSRAMGDTTSAEEQATKLEALEKVFPGLNDALDNARSRLEELKKSDASKVMAALGTGIEGVIEGAEEADSALKKVGLADYSELLGQVKMLEEAYALVGATDAPVEWKNKMVSAIAEMAEGLRDLGVDTGVVFSDMEAAASQTLSIVEQIGEAAASAGVDGALRLGDAFVDAAMGAKVSFRDLFKQIFADIMKAILKMMILKALSMAGPWGAAASTGLQITGWKEGGEVKGQTGGEVSGGVEGLDSVRALLMPGEVVLPTRMRDDFEALSEMAHAFRESKPSEPSAPGIYMPLTVVPKRNENDLAELIREISNGVQRHGWVLVASELTR